MRGDLHAYTHARIHVRQQDEEEDGGNAVYNLVEAKPPPPKAPDTRLVLSTVIPGTPASLYDVLLATKSHFMEDFLEAQGNRCALEVFGNPLGPVR